MPETIEVNIAVDEAHPRSFDGTVKDLESAGLRVRRVLRRLGIVTGTTERRRMAQLRRVDGVLSVDRDRPVRAQDTATT